MISFLFGEQSAATRACVFTSAQLVVLLNVPSHGKPSPRAAKLKTHHRGSIKIIHSDLRVERCDTFESCDRTNHRRNTWTFFAFYTPFGVCGVSQELPEHPDVSHNLQMSSTSCYRYIFLMLNDNKANASVWSPPVSLL